jgi:hypothetical protein
VALGRCAIGTALSLTLFACGSGSTSSTAPSSGVVSLTSSVSDSAGDPQILAVLRNGISVTPVVRVPPDLVAATLDASGGNLTATITFASGSLSHTDTSACLQLDVDENAATGNPSPGGDVALGFDYSVCGVSPRGSTTAQVSRLGGATAAAIGSVPVTFPTADAIRFTVPLSLLGNDDGRMAFKVNVIQWVDDPVVLNTGTIDWMPDLGRAAGLIR